MTLAAAACIGPFPAFQFKSHPNRKKASFVPVVKVRAFTPWASGRKTSGVAIHGILLRCYRGPLVEKFSNNVQRQIPQIVRDKTIAIRGSVKPQKRRVTWKAVDYGIRYSVRN